MQPKALKTGHVLFISWVWGVFGWSFVPDDPQAENTSAQMLPNENVS